MAVLIYRHNNEAAAADKWAKAHGVGAHSFRNPKYWHGPSDCDWYEAKMGEPPQPFDRYLISVRAPNLAQVIEDYRLAGMKRLGRAVEVEIVDFLANEAAAIERPGGEDLPAWELKVSPELYLRRNPTGPNSQLASRYVAAGRGEG